MAVVARTLERMREHLGLDIAYISQLDGDDMIVRAHCSPDFPADLPDQMTIPRAAGFCTHMVSGEIPQIIHDTSQIPLARDLPTRHDFNIQCYIGVPLHREDGTVYGSLCALGHHPNETLNDRDLRSIKLFAEIVAEQIDAELEDRREHAERLARVSAVIEEEAFDLHFQPIVVLESGQLKGFEALCRFQGTPYRTPDKWFGEAEAAGLGVELELAVIRKALETMRDLPDGLSIGLNLSPECLLSESLMDIFFDCPRERLLLEVTEHAVVRDYAALGARIAQYKAQGFRIAVDDAGAGYSSLSHILQLQPDVIKLDMSLTRNIHEDPVRRSLANALTVFARETNAEIVAEGIETGAERDVLEHLGAHYGQGYYFAKAMPVEEAIRFAARPRHQRGPESAAMRA
ncbi:MAG: EAL domain-containing protein [Pseudomonadota bacterium]